MRNIIALVLVSFITFSCSSDKKMGNMIITGQIKGLKKGTLYLQKMKDTVIVSVDSLQLLGDDRFTLTDNVDSPVMYYLTFDGNTQPKKIMFFGEKGNITIDDNVENFGVNPTITGSLNQAIMTNFNEIDNQFKSKRLDFIAKELEARSKNDTIKVDSLAKAFNQLIRRRFLFATNFAVSNSDSEVAPYIALTELYDANLYLLDTINNSLSEKVKNSDYGKRLNKFVNEIKEAEKKKDE
ncbi:thiol:disulfide interchange protein [Tenacibaculum sp. SZ-18]|uniref:DUF4369 domain-containing protein n=1 Tax=Tenacibaculum sp. SZ-18 TaxID=754423 RepID=UPI000C2D212F|nr:DUF4369 domain-containing protein [Tenacibaculum sp. SZ-18]AUC14284.1 thiol:disulfide interchange protein [Tenacibaculum sp. SZ-18]